MRTLLMILNALTLAATSTPAQAPPAATVTDSTKRPGNAPTIAGLDSAAAWPWRIVVIKSRLRQQEEARVWLPAEGDSVGLGIACVDGYINLAIVPRSFAAVEGVIPVGRQLGAILKINYRWEDSTIHDADFTTQGGGMVLWHVWRDPFGANDYFPSPKLAEQLGRHRALVAEWPNATGTRSEAAWSLPSTTQSVVTEMKRTCHQHK